MGAPGLLSVAGAMPSRRRETKAEVNVRIGGSHYYEHGGGEQLCLCGCKL